MKLKRLLAVLAVMAGFAAAPAVASASPWEFTFAGNPWSSVYLNPPPSNYVALGCNQTQYTYSDTANRQKVIANLCNAPTGQGHVYMNAQNWVCIKADPLQGQAQMMHWFVTKHSADCDAYNGFNDSDTQIYDVERVNVLVFGAWVKALRVTNKGTIGSSGLSCFGCNPIWFTALP